MEKGVFERLYDSINYSLNNLYVNNDDNKMSNDKQSSDHLPDVGKKVKLYTEEQVFKAIQMADKYHYLITSEECDIVNSLTPIELPSDEEILKNAIKPLHGLMDEWDKGFLFGAKWMHFKIQGGNNEQQ
jgi:bisphosphoglycerate-dependent phosphoglycerate mutase